MEPRTRAEQSSYEETSLHADVMTFLAAIDARKDRRFSLGSFGASPGGRELPLVVMSAHGVRTPADARRLGLPVVLIINGIHAGEVEGKEAAMMLVRDLLDTSLGDVLAELTLVVVPLYNPDGNDALAETNRALDLEHLDGQCGPLLVGTRVNAAGINLNRDYMRQAALESRLLSTRVVQAWAPELTIDTHATNGSVHRLAMTIDIPHTVESGRAEPIEFMRQRLLPDVFASLASKHSVAAGWYGNFVEDERALDARTAADPRAPVREGWMTYTHHPRFGSNYRGLTNRLDVLLECYSYIPFAERVHATYSTLVELLGYVARHRDDVMQVVAASASPRDRIAVSYRIDPFDTPIEVPTRIPRTLDGAPTTVTIPHLARFTGTNVVARPSAYLVPAAVGRHLAQHGLSVAPAPASVDVDVARVVGVAAEAGRKILESSTVGRAQIEWSRESRTVPSDAVLVRTDQPLGAIAVYLCEPESDDGAVENGLIAAP
ncbi:MAG TPA: M14 family metallopeptidase, partial [Kofleriaceae bacterium]